MRLGGIDHRFASSDVRAEAAIVPAKRRHRFLLLAIECPGKVISLLSGHLRQLGRRRTRACCTIANRIDAWVIDDLQPVIN